MEIETSKKKRVFKTNFNYVSLNLLWRLYSKIAKQRKTKKYIMLLLRRSCNLRDKI